MNIPQEILDALASIELEYLTPDGELRRGELVVHVTLAQEVQEIFAQLLELRFPIARIEPVEHYDWNDDASMAANNTSAFNYRTIAGQARLSNHATGRAIDINPLWNPYVRGTFIAPPGAVYDLARPGTITLEIASVFKERGWTWGGDWSDRKDWQHFEKAL